jgi:hypothetical protein
MADNPPKIPLGKLEWGVIFSMLVSGGSAIFSAGILYGDVKDHDRRLMVIETKSEGVTERLARIESNLDFLVEQYKQERKQVR